MIKKTTLSLALITSLSLIGCGSSSSDTNTETNPTTFTVERGATYDANVTDASGQIAIQVNGKNEYTFDNPVTYPISVNGGWIDVDGDGELTTEDIKLNITMVSYDGNTVTPTTTYIASSNKTERDNKLKELAILADTTTTDLLKPTSQASSKGMMVINAVYKEIVDNNSTNITTSQIGTTLSTLQNVDISGLTQKQIAIKLEKTTMDALLGDGKVTKITLNEMDELQSIRIFGTKWVNKKNHIKYIGNTVKVVDNKLELTANAQVLKDSSARLKSKRLKTKGTSFTAKYNILSIGESGSAKMQTQTYYNGKSYIVFKIKVEDNLTGLYVTKNVESNGEYTESPLIANSSQYGRVIKLENNSSIIGDTIDVNINIIGDNITFSINNETKNKVENRTIDMNGIAEWEASSKKLEKLFVQARVDNSGGMDSNDTTISTKIQLLNLELKAD